MTDPLEKLVMPDNFIDRIARLEAAVRSLQMANTGAATLDEVADDAGIIRGGAILTGEGDPFDTDGGFTGVGMASPGIDSGGTTYELFGMTNGALQIGIDNTGRLLAGGGAVIIDANGIKVGDAVQLDSDGAFAVSDNIMIDTANLGGNITKSTIFNRLADSDFDGGGNVIFVSATEIYTTGGTNAVQKWDGTAWSAVGTPPSGTSFIREMVRDSSGNLYISWAFIDTIFFAKWNGAAWTTLPNITAADSPAYCSSMAFDGSGNLHALIRQTGIGTPTSLYKYSGGAWTGVTSTNDSSNVMVVSGTTFYIGGRDFAGRQAIVRWNGTTRADIGSLTGGTGYCYGMAMAGTDLIIVGDFTAVNGVACNNIAKWNGTTWSAIGTGLDAAGLSIAVFGSTYIVVGYFTTAGGSAANRIAAWDGAAWSAFGSGLNSYASSISGTSATAFAVGGVFTSANGIMSKYITYYGPAYAITLQDFADQVDDLSIVKRTEAIGALTGNGNKTTIAAGGTAYAGPGYTGLNTVGANDVIIFLGAMKFLNFYATIRTTQPATGTLVFTLYNGKTSAVLGALTIAAGSGAAGYGSAINASISDGDWIYISIKNNASGASAQIAGWSLTYSIA